MSNYEKFGFNGKVGAKRKTFYIDDNIHEAWCPVLKKDDGSDVFITDTTTPSTVMEAESRYMALKKGKEVLERLGSVTK